MEIEQFRGIKERMFIKMEYIAINEFKKDVSVNFIKYACKKSDMLSFDIKKRIAHNKIVKRQFNKLCSLLDVSKEEAIKKYDNFDFIEQAFCELKDRKGIIIKWTNPLKGIEKELNISIEEMNRIKEKHIKQDIKYILLMGAGKIIYDENIKILKKMLEEDFVKNEYKINNYQDMEDYEICYYKISEKIEEIIINEIIEHNGIYYIEFPNFPENIKFYKNNQCWIETISHEELCFIDVENEKEYQELTKIGLKLKKS